MSPSSGQPTVVFGGAPSTATVNRIALRVVEGPDVGRTYESEDDKVTIGTHEGATLVLSDDTVSRFHCELSMHQDHVELRDLGSRNGTTLDGVMILGAVVREGSRVQIGRSTLEITFGKGGIELPLATSEGFGSMVGRSQSMRRAFAVLQKASISDANVLLLGETGTGKEITAESVHEASGRSDGPFVVVDCGAIPSQLLESELFGHVRGAFTGAVTDRPGAFRAARGGTLFLDEIGELSIELQPKLLRALERRQVKRVGETKYEPVDVRFIAATHRDLKSEVNRGTFRADLYYRLAVLEIRLPPLRERLDDLPLLVERLVAAMNLPPDHPFANPLADPTFVADLKRHAWPGNVRELRNFLERCIAMQERVDLQRLAPEGQASAPADTPEIDPTIPLRMAREGWVASFERQYLLALLDQHGGNVSQAARSAGVNRGHMYRLLTRYDLK